jgi:hypothetical protein
VIPIIFAIVNVSDMIPKYADAKEGQILYDTYAGFFDNTGDHLLLGTKTKTASYHIETIANNIAGAPSSVQENDTHMSTIAKESSNKNYIVTLSWDPQELKPGRNTIFLVNFFYPKTQIEIKQIDYSFSVFSSSTSSIVKYTQHQKAPNGMGAQIVNFPRAGQADISLNITKYEPNTSAATNISGEVRNRVENVTFPVMIIP